MVNVLFKNPRLLAVFLAAILVSVICGCSKDDDDLPMYGPKIIEWSSSIEPVQNSGNVPIWQVPVQGGEYEIEASNLPVPNVYLYQAIESKSFGASSDKGVSYLPEYKECTSLVTSYSEIQTEGNVVRVKIKANETGADRYLYVSVMTNGFTYLGYLYFMQKGDK